MSTQDIVILSTFETFGDSTLRMYAQSDNLMYLGYGVIAYIGVIVYLIKCLQSQNVMYVKVVVEVTFSLHFKHAKASQFI